jgi:hypothetical protein
MIGVFTLSCRKVEIACFLHAIELGKAPPFAIQMCKEWEGLGFRVDS